MKKNSNLCLTKNNVFVQSFVIPEFTNPEIGDPDNDITEDIMLKDCDVISGPIIL